MENISKKITTNYYKILQILYSLMEQSPNGVYISKVKQTEIAEKLGINKMTVNAIFKELMSDGLVTHYGNKRGVYCLTDTAIDIVKKVNKI